jgi:hypothetical protein
MELCVDVVRCQMVPQETASVNLIWFPSFLALNNICKREHRRCRKAREAETTTILRARWRIHSIHQAGSEYWLWLRGTVAPQGSRVEGW